MHEGLGIQLFCNIKSLFTLQHVDSNIKNILCLQISLKEVYPKAMSRSGSYLRGDVHRLIRKWVAVCSILFTILLYASLLESVSGLREFRSWSARSSCKMAEDANYPFAYAKYKGQLYENKGRVNSNLQDFRHNCVVQGGRSKCNICESIECQSSKGQECFLQLQGVDGSQMSVNVPTVSDTAWAVNGKHRKDFGGNTVSHFCTFLTGQNLYGCTKPDTTDFSNCKTRCFGWLGFLGQGVHPAKLGRASNRSVTDQYPGMRRWAEDGQVDMWTYPMNCSQLSTDQGVNCVYSGLSGKKPSFNPQGFVFTHSGSGTPGFLDGPATQARFQSPDDLVVDKYGYIYVADTENNAIRVVALDGSVTTLAGKGPTMFGAVDGPCSTATFTEPRGLDVEVRTLNGLETTVIVVADTGNHRIRRIDYVRSTSKCTVSCLSGLCGNNSISATTFKTKATPYSGYADGLGTESRFSAPEGVAFMDGHNIAVADTGNFLIRWIFENGTTMTLAGDVVPGQMDAVGNPIAGCLPPCLRGQAGYRDGNLTHAQFLNPLDVTRGLNNTVWVTDEHRIRIIELPSVITTLYTIQSMGRVSTMAGTALQGHEDGMGDVATFFNPSGVTVTSDSRAYVLDAASCRVRRITPLPLVVEGLTCSSQAISYIRPSGCTSYDQPLDKTGRKVSRGEANIQYNFGYPYEQDPDRGKYPKNCVGTPPFDTLDKRFVGVTGDNLVIDDSRYVVNEDSEQGMSILMWCPVNCDKASTWQGSVLEGSTWYSERSSICRAAIHQGTINRAAGGYVRVTFQRRDYLALTPSRVQYLTGSLANTVNSANIPADIPRVFTTSPHRVSEVVTHTVAGHPAADLESGCGFKDAQPPMLAYFNKPRGISAKPNTAITDDNFLYIADTLNHRIRALSATCTQICENGGTCVGPDTCMCQSGWLGIDCTIVDKATCGVGANPCGFNKLCVAPGVCACKPGFEPDSQGMCTQPQCIQTCYNGGQCTAPDTCSCASGWFDSNCTTPVCSNTCANGGNCTSPNTCSCPTQWSGSDCRTPVCTQTCLNGGSCVAPNTCKCPPQWANFDCSVPVCTQGMFVPNPGDPFVHHLYKTEMRSWPTYRPCNREQWCNFTREFECEQLQMSYSAIEVPSGPMHRAITGRKTRPNQCMNIELPIDYKLPFELQYADGSTTGVRRYAPLAPYQSDPQNEWRGYLSPVQGHTGPWTYGADRQVANVEWLNISQGVYVCANGGNCTSPGVCECAAGWSGFDCRTPICNQGYYHPHQTTYVSGMETPTELARFRPFMDTNNSYFRDWPYSNPTYTMEWELYANVSSTIKQTRTHGGQRYLAVSEWSSGFHVTTPQGGYKCSVRSVTEWENQTYVLSHPNYYSRYMDYKKQVNGIAYTFWFNMSWPPVHQKSRVLDQRFDNVTYAYTNNGYRRGGSWNTTANTWQYGVCVMEFQRNCSDKSKELDLESGLLHRIVQDPDLAYRPRVRYNDKTVIGYKTHWRALGGECVDLVLRGCFNNGTCVAPNTCQCAKGWSGYNCNTPVCDKPCLHGGNCTQPNQCTCEKGWTGPTCLTPLCAQDCMNGGVCIAPDTCRCLQWENAFRDGRLGGGKPLFQDNIGNPLKTGWTGYDCATPVCVQASTFYVNVPGGKNDPNFVALGGHGADNTLSCADPNTGALQPRCPMYDIYVTGNEGATFQAGCGFDPYDTGCCIPTSATAIQCYRCDKALSLKSNSTFFCQGTYTTITGLNTEKDKFAQFLDIFGNFKICGTYHNPRDHDSRVEPQDYGIVKYYKDFLLRPAYSNRNYLSKLTSNRFLCNVRYWEQGDYLDDAGYGSITGVGSLYGLKKGRHYRVNYANMIQLDADNWKLGPVIPGEGIFACENSGSCLAPDICSCTNGYEGYNCNTPLCRHLQPGGTVSSCSNGGICESKDKCDCVRVQSKLVSIYPQSPAGQTGWTGTDCTIPMCVQGYYDPFCTDLPEAPAGEGCYRCANGGNCTAPDVCTCAPGWSGFDCKTPLCEVVADPLTRTQLGAIFEDKVISFETDPCGLDAIYGVRGWKGRKYARGNCTEPNVCSCLCKEAYNAKACKKNATQCQGPWQDPIVKFRNLVGARGPEYAFGSTGCTYGYEGNVNEMDQFVTCHHTIYIPSLLEKYTMQIAASFVVGSFIFATAYYFIAARMKQRFILAKIERRRSKRSSEESLLGNDGNRKSTRKSSANN